MLATMTENHQGWDSHLGTTCMAYPIDYGTVCFLSDVRWRERILVDMLCGTEQMWTDEKEVIEYVAQQSKISQEAYSYGQNKMGLHQDRQKELYDQKWQ